MERAGLVWDVVKISRERELAKAVGAPGARVRL
jgi:hypothetical protein